MIVNDAMLDEFFAKLAADPWEGKQTPPDAHEADDGDLSSDSEDVLKVAGDGACPGGQDDLRLRTAGIGLWYGKGHIHNRGWALEGSSQGTQRA